MRQEATRLVSEVLRLRRGRTASFSDVFVWGGRPWAVFSFALPFFPCMANFVILNPSYLSPKSMKTA
jgi:hypothetical protein